MTAQVAAFDTDPRLDIFGLILMSMADIGPSFPKSKPIFKERSRMAHTVLVTAATGKIAEYLIPQLTQSGFRVKALVHNQRGVGEIAGQGVECIVGGFFDTEAIKRAVHGVDSIVLITPATSDSVEMVNQILSEARMQGSPHVVRVSVIHASQSAPSDNARQHFFGEMAVRQSGLPWTILRPNFFMQNFLSSANTIISEGAFFYGMDQGRLGMIDVRDIADSISAILAGENHNGKTYSLTGPESVTMMHVAEALSKELESPVKYVPVKPERVASSLRTIGFDEWYARAMADYNRAYASGWGDIVTNTIFELCGHKPRSIEEFAHEIFAHLVTIPAH